MCSLLAAIGACGVPTDSRPRAVPAEVRTLLTVPDTSAPGRVDPQGGQVALYFLRDTHLTETFRKLAGAPTAAAVIRLLLAGPSQDERQVQGLTTALPTSVGLLGTAKTDDNVLHIDLGGGNIGTIGGDAAKAAFAQIVLTVRSLGFDRVSFSVEGIPTEAPTDDGNKAIVEAANYKPPLLPS